MILLIDIGNTRIKWAQLDGTALGSQSAEPHAAWSREDFARAIAATIPQPQRVLVSNVAGERIAEVVRESVRVAWGLSAEFVQSSAQAGGVRNAYREPAKLGVDRWLAVIAAHAIERRATCVVSIGTAMTIDGVDASGRHLGGVIVAGPDLMISSLLHKTSDIAQRAQTDGTDTVAAKSLFADSTLQAVQQGAAHALAALVERAVETMQEDVNQKPVLLLTGGATAAVASALRLPYTSMPDLVMRGLAVLAQPVK